MKKIIEVLKKYRLAVLIGFNFIITLGLSIYAYYNSTIVILPQETKKEVSEVKEEQPKVETSQKTDFSAKRAKREREYFANAQRQPNYIISEVNEVEEEVPIDTQSPTIEIPEQPSVQSENKPNINSQKPEEGNQGNNGEKPIEPQNPINQPKPNNPVKPEEKPNQSNPGDTQPSNPVPENEVPQVEEKPSNP